MKKSSLLNLISVSALGLSAFVFSSSALAQAPAAPTAAPAAQLNVGPTIPGLCVYSVEAAVGQSEMGLAAGERMKSLQAIVEAEIKPERSAIEAQAAALQAEQKTATREQFAPKAQAFQARAQAFEEKVNLRVKELQATQQKAQQMIGVELEAPLQVVYQAKGCGLLVDRNAVLFANPAMDITGDVVLRLNATKKTINFDRERLDAGQASAPRAAARPAAPSVAKPVAKPAVKPATAAPKPAVKPTN